MKKKWIKFFILSTTSLFGISFMAYSDGIPVHKSVVTGLKKGERLLIRIDNKNFKNGKVFQSGYYTFCADNGWVLFDPQIFSSSRLPEHYQYNVSYSLCHSLDDLQYDDNRCELLTEIQIHADKNENNEITVNIPDYALNLESYSGQSTPCAQRLIKDDLINSQTGIIK